MTGWHASDDLVTRYGDGTLPEPDAWSLEKHLESCGRCAARVSRAVRETAAGVVLAEVRDTVLRAAPAYAREAVPGGAARRPAKTAPNAPRTTAAAAPGPAPAAQPRQVPATGPGHAPTAGPEPTRTPALGRASGSPAKTAPNAPRTTAAAAPGPAPAAQPRQVPATGPGHAPTAGPEPTRTPVLGGGPGKAASHVRRAAVAARPGRAPGAVPASATPAATPAPARATPAPSHPFARARLRLPRHLGLPVGSRLTRVLWAAGPAVRGAWLPAVLLVAFGAVALAYGADFAGARPLLLAIAPVVPVAGVALSYGSHADPLHEIAASTPSAGLRLVLTRTAAVLAVSLPLLTLAGVLVPSSGAPGAAAWLLPGLALTLASLTLAGHIGWRAATAVTGGGWLSAVLAPALVAPGGRLTARLSEQLAYCLDGAPAQGGWAAAAVLCAVLLAARRPAHDRLERP
ncbi:zf-HC2 domain-containing protein [Streptomyces sp. NPDC058676]|uniref:zf-HC2 domain-containing protein n=1 Tax=unclassified Streptomyces TaxID=2593676 RepID=UPI003661FFAD